MLLIKSGNIFFLIEGPLLHFFVYFRRYFRSKWRHTIGFLHSSTIQYLNYIFLHAGEDDQKRQRTPVKCEHREIIILKISICISGEETSLLEQVFTAVEKLCKDVHHTTYQVIFTPISKQLEQVATAPAWNSKEAPFAVDLPDFSFAPQEYITQVIYFFHTVQLILPILNES